MGKSFYNGPDRPKAKHVLALSRAKLGIFVRIISGHNSLLYFRSKIDPDVDPKCRFCGQENEEFLHLINDCPRFIIFRRDKLQNIPISNDHLWSISKLIAFSMLPGVSQALEGDPQVHLDQPTQVTADQVSTDSDDSEHGSTHQAHHPTTSASVNRRGNPNMVTTDDHINTNEQRTNEQYDNRSESRSTPPLPEDRSGEG